jgi:hypothetical protein
MVARKPGPPGSFHAGFAVFSGSVLRGRCAHRLGHVTHPGVQPHGIPVDLQMIKLGTQDVVEQAQQGGFWWPHRPGEGRGHLGE